MTNTCIVFDCTSGEDDNGELNHFFRVPRDLELQRRWEQAIPKVKEPLTSEHLVCDKHFLESDMIRYYIVKDDAGIVVKKVPYTYPRLTDTAVPSIFPGFELRRNAQNPEPPQRTIGPDVVIYDNPVADAYTRAAVYPIWPDLSYNGHATCVHGHNTRPEPADQISNNSSTNIGTSTVISGSDGTTTHDSADHAATVATPCGDGQNVANGISGDSTLTGGDTSHSIISPPDVSIDGTTDIAAQITSFGNYQTVGNGISEHPGTIDTAAIGNTFLPQNDTATDTMNLVGSASKSGWEWEKVIVDEPVSTLHQTSTSYIPPDTGCCPNADGDCCCDDCGCDCNCCDDCNCDGCGDCDCGGCGDCDCGGCDCGGLDCSGCDCGGCTIM